jgi:hypothetical protein
MVVYAIAIIMGSAIVLQDVLHGRVHVILLLGFLLSCIAICSIEARRPCFIPLAIVLLVGGVHRVTRGMSCLGLADYFVVSAMELLYNHEVWPWFVMISGGLGILTSFLCRRERFPFTPAIMVSGLIARFLVMPG